MQPVVPVPSATKNEERVWLDEIPLEICSNIAKALAYSDQYPSVIYLSKVSETQKTAAKQGLSYSIETPWWLSSARRSELLSLSGEIAALLQDDVRAIYTRGPYLVTENMQECFSSPALVKVFVFELPPDFEALVYAKNLRSLRLKNNNIHELIPLLNRLSVLELRELKLITMQNECLHQTLCDVPENYGLLASIFPRLESLSLICQTCVGPFQPPSLLWRAIEPFPVLREVTLVDLVPEDAIERLKQMDCVKLRIDCTEEVLELIEKIASRVVAVYTSRPGSKHYGCVDFDLILSRSQLERFVICTNLKKLECCIERGAESSLVQVVGNLRYLRVVFDDEEGHRADGNLLAKSYEPEPDAILNVVKAAPFLTDLRLCNMRVRRSELRDILRSFGTRLEIFGETRSDHSEHEGFKHPLEKNREELEDLIEIYRTAVVHNDSLQSLVIDAEASWFTDREVVSSLLPKLQTTLDLIRRKLTIRRGCILLFGSLVRKLRAYCGEENDSTGTYSGDESGEDGSSESTADDSRESTSDDENLEG